MINIEDIKIGKTYLLPFEVIKINDTDIHMRNGGVKGIFQPEELTEISSESAQKYAPNRKFRKGDEVHMKPEVNGRPVYIGEDAWEPLDPNEIWTVEEDELETGWVRIKTDCVHATVWHAMIELVTPVEERERYIVKKYSSFYAVEKRNDLKDRPATYDVDFHPNAKAAAEAECDRLNAEYRKEKK